MQEAAAAEEEGSFEMVATRPTAAGGAQLAAKPSRSTEYQASGGRALSWLQSLAPSCWPSVARCVLCSASLGGLSCG